MALVVFVIFCGRVTTAHESVESAATDAARTASIGRNPVTAKNDAAQAAASSLAGQGLHCRHINVDVNTTGFTKPAGQPATVTATVSCTLDLSDLAVPGIPGTRTISATVSSPIDTWRQP